MEPHQLLYFRELAKNNSVSKTSRLLNITQPTLSRSIKNLEEELDVQLFDRERGKLKLNETGKMFLEHVEKALYELSAGEAKCKNISRHNENNVHICCKPNYATSEIMAEFVLAHPEMVINQLDLFNSEIGEYLLNFDVEFAVCFDTSMVISEEFIWEPLYDDHFYIMVAKENELSLKKEVSISDLSNQRFIINNSLKDLTNMIYYMCSQAGYLPEVVYNGSQQAVVDKLVMANFGISVQTESVKNIRTRKNPEIEKKIAHVRIKEDKCKRTIGIVRLKNKKLTKNAQIIHDYLKNRIVDYTGCSRPTE